MLFPGRLAPNVAALSPGPAAWTPASIGAEVWFDPSYLSNIWQERSTNGSGVTTPGAVDAVIGTIFNRGSRGGVLYAGDADSRRPILRQSSGLHRIELDGVNDGLISIESSLYALRGVPGFTMCIASTKGAGAGDRRLFSVLGGALTRTLLYNNGTNLVGGARRLNSDSLATLSYGSPHLSTSHILTYIVDYTAGTTRIRRNGAQIASGSISTGVTENNSGVVALGINTDGVNNSLDGSIYQAVLVERVIDAGELASLEAFMSEKSGIAI